MRACLVGLVVALGLGSSAGCGLTLDLEPEPDGGSDADLGVIPERDLGAGTDLGQRDPCERADDGSLCAIEGSIDGVCVGGRCMESECGDGYLSGTELCDDGNTEDGDGCQANCRPGCTSSAECPSTECTSGTCEGGRCAPTPAPDGTDCLGGVCRGGTCATPNCGNGVVDDDELCDDGNRIDRDGCDTDCHPSCEFDESCGDGVVCNGMEQCTAYGDGRALCEPADVRPPLPRPCDYCDESTGTFELRDLDGDGYSPISGDGCGPLDCDDMNPTTYPGAPETTIGVDSNCDGEIATDVRTVCYEDFDEDGFGDPFVSMEVPGGSCPDGFLPAGPHDCNDVDPAVYPGQLSYFEDPYCDAGICSYDYDCDGREERRFTNTASCSGATRSTCEAGRAGWTSLGIPDCGQFWDWGECQWTGSGCIAATLPSPVIQSCR